MADIFDYLQWRGDLSFTQDPPNAIDALIFSAISYISPGGRAELQPEIPFSLRDVANEFFTLPEFGKRCRVQNDIRLLREAAQSSRFGNCMIWQYRDMLVPEEETQFAAVTFLLDNGTAFIAYRGTDSSLVGWKEDFNMSFQDTIPSQGLAAAYAAEIAERYHLPMYLGGHSKGGNLAVFAASKVSPAIQDRIIDVYSLDGPGFSDFLLEDPGYLRMVPNIHTIIPQSSVIGMLLEHKDPYTVVKSKGMGIMQHELYTWEVMGNHFIAKEGITADSHFLNQAIKNWVAKMTVEERNELVDTVFELLSTGDVDNVMEILHPKNIKGYLQALSTNGKYRKVLSDDFLSFLDAARNTQLRLENKE